MADNTPNKPDDKKAGPASEIKNTDKAAPGKEPVTADGKSPDKVVVLPVQNKEQEKAAAQEGGKAPENTPDKKSVAPVADKKTVDKTAPVKDDKAAADETLKKEQEALLKSLDNKAANMQKNNPAPKKKAAEKVVPITAAKKPDEKQKREARPPTGPKEAAPPKEPEKPPEPKEARRPEKTEEVVFIKLSELFPFKDHPFQVRSDEEMSSMVESVKDKGITQPATVRPREGGGYEMVSGHRRQKASELAGLLDMPCIVRNMTDEQAITQMVEDNTTQRETILPSEKAKALKMQLDAIKRQGARGDLGAEVKAGNGQRSNEIVAERNKMSVKNVQRFIKLNDIVPDLMKYIDHKIDKIQIGFTTAVELAYISPKNQRYIAVAVEGNQSSPSLAQAQRMRELDQQKALNPDVIDGILMEQKKEVDKVIISSQELSQYFGKDKTPRDMKDKIIELLETWKGQQKDIAAPDKKEKQPEK